MTFLARTLALLQESPATSLEISAELDISLRHASANLCVLHKRGLVERREIERRPITFLWELSKGPK